jgi:putative transcriptional regulator
LNPRHHPTRGLLSRYAYSDLEAGPALVIACHLETCPSCLATVQTLDEVHASALETMPPTAMSEDALRQALLRIQVARRDGAPSAVTSMLGDVTLPSALTDARFHARKWISPGLWAAHLKTERKDHWRTFILRAPGNTTIPSHAHPGDEFISVLQGAFHDGDAYSAGDFAANIKDSSHAMHVESDGPCVCLIAVRGALRWHGWSRAIGPILGI